MKKVKIMTVCGFGVGSSLILKMKIEKALDEEGLNAEVFCSDVTTATAMDCDIVFSSSEISSQLDTIKKPKVTINNFMNIAEIKEKAVPAVQKLLQD